MTAENFLETGRQAGERIWGKARFARMEQSGEEMHPLFWNIALTSWVAFSRTKELEPRIRSLCLVAALTALSKYDELRIHIFGALNNGATKQEVEEVIVHMAPYVGIPAARGGLLTAKKCFADYQPPPDR